MSKAITPHSASNNSMSIRSVAVVGLGYVGAVSAAMLARRSLRVIGVETHPRKLAAFQAGQCPIREPGLDAAIQQAVMDGRFTATDDLAAAAREADVILIAVGTPSDATGQSDLSAIDRVTEQLAASVSSDLRRRVVLVRSTVPPGTTAHRVAPVLREANPNTIVGHHPEFLREGSALRDFDAPALIVFGCAGDDRATVSAVMAAFYGGIDAPRLALDTAESEMIKYACNAFHAIKINFANEIGSLAAAAGADPQAVMDAFCRDGRLNISPAYLRPGFAFGGSCLPKDTRALIALARQYGIDLPMIGSVLSANAAHLDRQLQRILALGRQETLLIGLSFKAGSDDLRESPMVELAERLLGKGVPLRIYDADLDADALPGTLLGANARYVQQHLPHLADLLVGDLPAAIAAARTIVIAKPAAGLESLDLTTGRSVIDLTRLTAADLSRGSAAVSRAA